MSDFFERLGDFLKDILYNIFDGIFSAIVEAFKLFHYIIYKIFLLGLTFATIGFAVGVVFLILNVIEAINGVWFNHTRFFVPMIWLFGAYIVLFAICRIIRPRD